MRGIRLAVVIVAWNNSRELSRTLPAVLAELGPGDELIVVDNASSDGTAEVVRRLAPEAQLLELAENTGFGAGANLGARAATAELLVFLNPDATPRAGFGEAIRRPLAQNRGWDAWMGLVTDQDGAIVNTWGGVLHFTGIAWAGGAGEPVPSLEPAEVAFLSGACLAAPREIWLRHGGFCERYFLYHEDVDLSLRIRLAGGRLGIEPAAVVDHEYEFSANLDKYRYMERNRWATVLRTYPWPVLLACAPALLVTELALLAVAPLGGWGRSKIRADVEALRDAPTTLGERRRIQAGRQVSAGEFAAYLTAELDSAYLGRTAQLKPVVGLLRSYWRLARALLRAPDPKISAR